MADVDHTMAARMRLKAIEKSMDGGGGPPHNDGMEARVYALEEAVKNLPTKTDFAELRADIAKGQADMHKAIADNHRWTHTALMGLAAVSVAGIVGVMGTIWSIGKPTTPQASAPQAQQPIVINNIPPASASPPALQPPAPQQPAP